MDYGRILYVRFFVGTFLPCSLMHFFCCVDYAYGCWSVSANFLRFSGAAVTSACVYTSWRVEKLVAWLCEGLKALAWCLALAACVFGAKNRIIHFLAICVFSPFFIFFELQLARARFFVPTGICKALFLDSASVLNAFWPARIVVACFGVFRGEIFYGCKPMIFPGFSGGGLPTIVLCTNWRQERLVRGYG